MSTSNATATIRPGLLVALKTSVQGGVHYERRDLESDGRTTRWETTRIMTAPEEREAANQARSDAARKIGAVCSRTAFGLLCPVDAEQQLDSAIAEAQQIRDRHNAAATCTRVDVYVIKGRIADTDEQAAKAIGSEVREMIAAMTEGIDRIDPKAIRDAANRARELSAMLAPERAEAVQSAIQQARAAARQIVARVEKGGELAEIVLADVQRGALKQARMMFLDFDEAPASDGPVLPAIAVQRFAEIDADPAEMTPPPATVTRAIGIGDEPRSEVA